MGVVSKLGWCVSDQGCQTRGVSVAPEMLSVRSLHCQKCSFPLSVPTASLGHLGHLKATLFLTFMFMKPGCKWRKKYFVGDSFSSLAFLQPLVLELTQTLQSEP